MDSLLQSLLQFLTKASLATYVGGGSEIEPQRPKFNELAYEEGDWTYRDSYSGYFQSCGQEVVWHKQKPFWTQLYGGGMESSHQNDKSFADLTFQFLKKAMSSGKDESIFQPRGPKNLKKGDWEYVCEWGGDITKFKGHEKILFKTKVVFTHDFFGGLFLSP
jgi:hypothetical protein